MASAASCASCLGELPMDLVASCLGYVEDLQCKRMCSSVCHLWRKAVFCPKSWKHVHNTIWWDCEYGEDFSLLPITIINRFGSGMVSLLVKVEESDDEPYRFIMGTVGVELLEFLDAISTTCTSLQELSIMCNCGFGHLVFPAHCIDKGLAARKSEIQGRVVQMVRLLAERCGGRMAKFSTDLLDVDADLKMKQLEGLYEQTDVIFEPCPGSRCQEYYGLYCRWKGEKTYLQVSCDGCGKGVCDNCLENNDAHCFECGKFYCQSCIDVFDLSECETCGELHCRDCGCPVFQ